MTKLSTEKTWEIKYRTDASKFSLRGFSDTGYPIQKNLKGLAKESSTFGIQKTDLIRQTEEMRTEVKQSRDDCV